MILMKQSRLLTGSETVNNRSTPPQSGMMCTRPNVNNTNWLFCLNQKQVCIRNKVTPDARFRLLDIQRFDLNTIPRGSHTPDLVWQDSLSSGFHPSRRHPLWLAFQIVHLVNDLLVGGFIVLVDDDHVKVFAVLLFHLSRLLDCVFEVFVLWKE